MNVKVVVSLGPASGISEIVDEMVSLGVSGFRVNFAHGGPTSWSNYVRLVRDAESRNSRYVALIGDLMGPSLRLGNLKDSVNAKKGALIRFSIATKVEPTRSGEDITEVPVEVSERVLEELDVGDVILMDDGRISFTVVNVGDTYFDAIAQTDSMLTSRKALVVKGKEFDLPIPSRKDLDDIRFACSEGFDYLGLSYVKIPEEVSRVRKILEKLGCELGILVKIETLSALKNLDNIIESSDGVVVARGDLGMNIGLEDIPALQKKIVSKSKEHGKPIIVATQLLESMTRNPVPTRAEVVDVYEAVQSGVDALMVTGETAVGRYPVEVVKWLNKIIKAAEAVPYEQQKRIVRDLRARFVKGVVELVEDLGATLLVYSMRGNTARMVSTMRPRVTTYVGTPRREVARKLSILWGLKTHVIEASSYPEGLEKLYTALISSGYLKMDEIVVLVYGLIEEYEEIIRIRRVSL